MAKKVRSKSRRSRTRRSGRKMRGGMYRNTGGMPDGSPFTFEEDFSGPPAFMRRRMNPRNIGTGGVLRSDSRYARSLPNTVGGHRELRELERLREEGPVDIGSDELRRGLAQSRVEASARRECELLPQRYSELYELIMGFTNLLNHPRVREFLDANGDEILFPDGESINSFKERVYARGRELPQPDVFNGCNCR